MYSVIFTQAARAELIAAQDWYEREATGLGRRFQQAIDALVVRMSENSRQFPTVFKNLRRALLRRFPYSLFFVVEGDRLNRDRLLSRQPRSVALAKADLTALFRTGKFCTTTIRSKSRFRFSSGCPKYI